MWPVAFSHSIIPVIALPILTLSRSRQYDAAWLATSQRPEKREPSTFRWLPILRPTSSTEAFLPNGKNFRLCFP
jgi:hypothetical protein